MTKEEKINKLQEIYKDDEFILGISLAYLNKNNGWNSIPSIHEKEIEKGHYWVVYPNGFIEVAHYNGTMEGYKFWKLNFTHYQPIKKPKPPIY